jgi:cytochrome c oxidase subunit IV
VSAPHVATVRSYLQVFAALLGLTALTVWAATTDLGRWNDTLALAIATTKALLVALFFMHLRQAERLVWIFAGVGILWLLILLGLTVADFDTRALFSAWAE